MATVYVVTHHYEACGEGCCSAGSHVVGVFATQERAEEAERNHRDDHGTYSWTDVTEHEVEF